MNRLSPSLLSADFAMLAEEIAIIEHAGADLIHVDVMDGHFVPNISMGPKILQDLYNKTTISFDVHLMIEKPERYIERFVTDRTEFITVHSEACTHLHRVIQEIKSFGVKAGVAINPATSLDVLDYIYDDLDLVLIMSVNPGFGGQNFIPSALQKIKQVYDKKVARGLCFDIQVDGGITLENAELVLAAGANILVAGSSVFGAPDVYEETKKFIELLNHR